MTPDEPRTDAEPEDPDVLLAAALSSAPPPELGARLAALTERGWTALLARALADEVAALLHHRLDRRGLLHLAPAAVAEALADAHRRAAEQNERIYAELGTVLAALGDIPVVVLKGAYLAEAMYEQRALRLMEDVDILVPGDRLDETAEVLRELGYGHETREEMRGVFALNHHLPPFSRPGCTVIEVHWSIDALCAQPGGAPPVSPFTLDLDGIWARTRPARVAGHDVLALSPEDLLLHLSVHAGFHHGLHVAIRRLCDVAAVLEREEIDWARFADTARRWGAEPFAAVILRLARDLLAAPVPDAALAPIAWTPYDQDAYPALRDYVLHLPYKFTPDWRARRPAVDRWLMRGTQVQGRGAHLAEATPGAAGPV